MFRFKRTDSVDSALEKCEGKLWIDRLNALLTRAIQFKTIGFECASLVDTVSITDHNFLTLMPYLVFDSDECNRVLCDPDKHAALTTSIHSAIGNYNQKINNCHPGWVELSSIVSPPIFTCGSLSTHP